MKVGDELQIQYGQKIVTVRVDRIADTTRKDEAAELYTLLKEEARPKENLLDWE